MSQQLIIGLFMALAFALGGTAVYAYREMGDLYRRIGALEKHSQTRHTLETIAGLDDGTAVNVDLCMRYQAELQYITARLDQQRNILNAVREGPHAYPVDRPAGMRPGKRAK